MTIERKQVRVLPQFRPFRVSSVERSVVSTRSRKAAVVLVAAAAATAAAQGGGVSSALRVPVLDPDLQILARPIMDDAAARCLGRTSVPTSVYEIAVNGVSAEPPLAGKPLDSRMRYTPIGNGAVIVESLKQLQDDPKVRSRRQQVTLFPGAAVWSVSHVLHLEGPQKGETEDSFFVARDVKCLEPLFPLAVGKEFVVSSVTETRTRSSTKTESLGSRQYTLTLKVVAGPMSLADVRSRHVSTSFSGPTAVSWKFYELESTFRTGVAGPGGKVQSRYLFVEDLDAFVRLWDGELLEGHRTTVVAE